MKNPHKKIIKTLKKHFIPHLENNHRPYFLRKKSVLILVALTLLLELTLIAQVLFVIPSSSFLANILPTVVGSLTNNERLALNLRTLVKDDLLEQAAKMKAEDMAEKSYFAHTSPEGKTPWDWLDAVGYEYSYAGENLAVNFVDSEDVMRAWMKSQSHRDNILNGSFTEIGIGTANGIYKDKEAVFIVQMFGRPITRSVPEPVIARAETPKKHPPSEEGPSIVKKSSPTTSSEVAGATDIKENAYRPSLYQKLLASPKNNINLLLYVLFAVVVIALFLNIIIKLEIQHPDLIINGLIIVTIITGTVVLNSYLGLIHASVS